MKKLALLAAMAVMLGSMAFAEKTIEVGGKFGLGPTLGTKVENMDDAKAKMAFDFGIYGHIGLVDLGPGTLAIQPEFLFTIGNGVKVDWVLGDVKYTFNSIDIPVLICYDIPVGKLSIRPFVGPQIGFGIGEYKMDNTDSGIKAKGILFGAVFGCGIAVPVGPVVIGGDIRYNIDFTKAKDEDDEDVARRGALMFNLAVAYKFK